MKDILLITPPFTQLNTPYPATAYIKGFLNTKDISAFQMDLGIEVILEMFSKEGLESLFQVSGFKSEEFEPNSQRIFALKNDYTIVEESQAEEKSFPKPLENFYKKRNISETGRLPF